MQRRPEQGCIEQEQEQQLEVAPVEERILADDGGR